MRNRDGFTLLELVAALSLSAVIGIWAAGFFGSQMHEYKKQTQILKTEELADRVCFQITSRLDHAFLFRVDPKESSVLYYCEGSGELGEQWEQISEEDLGLGAEKEYEVRLDFSDTQSQKAVSEITVLYIRPNRPHDRMVDGSAYAAPCITIARSFALSLIPRSKPSNTKEYPFFP